MGRGIADPKTDAGSTSEKSSAKKRRPGSSPRGGPASSNDSPDPAQPMSAAGLLSDKKAEAIAGVNTYLEMNDALTAELCLSACKNKWFEPQPEPEAATKDSPQHPMWHHTYTWVSDCPLYYFAKVLSEVQPALTPALLNKVHENDKTAIYDIVNHGAQFSKKWRLTPEGLVKSIFDKLLRARLQSLNILTAEWVQQAIDANTGEIDWDAVQVVTFDTEDPTGQDSLIKSVKMGGPVNDTVRLANHPLTRDAPVTKDWECQNAWSLSGAKTHKGSFKITWLNVFSEENKSKVASYSWGKWAEATAAEKKLLDAEDARLEAEKVKKEKELQDATKAATRAKEEAAKKDAEEEFGEFKNLEPVKKKGKKKAGPPAEIAAAPTAARGGGSGTSPPAAAGSGDGAGAPGEGTQVPRVVAA